MLALWSWQAIFWILVGLGLFALVGLLALPETLPPQRRSSQRLSEVLIGYVTLARNRKLLGYAVAGGFFFGGLYAYLAGTPFAYIEYYHVPPQAYGLLFGVNIAGMMAANLINTRLVMRVGSDQMFRFGAAVAAVAGIALAVDSRFGWGGLAGLVVPLFCYVVDALLAQAPHAISPEAMNRIRAMKPASQPAPIAR